MTLGSSSNSCLNNASLAGSYLSLMFCAFPKPLSQGSGLGLRVTSNDNLFVVICVQTTRDIQNSNTAFLKKGKSIMKLSYLKQIFQRIKKNVKEKLALPAPPFNMQEQSTSFISAGWFLMQVHIFRAIHGPWTLWHCFQVTETRWAMQMSWPKSRYMQAR